jgi:hypothetical protein
VLSLGICLDVDRLRREKGELIGELAVACDMAGAFTTNGYLNISDFNLSSVRARSERAKLLRERSNAADVDWFGLVDELATRSIEADRQGAPAKPLATYERSGPEASYNVHGWSLLRDHQTILFGDGGSLKSYLALYAAGVLATRGVNTLYADWELDGSAHRERLERLFGPDMPTVHYLRCDRPLTLEADRITREVRRLSTDFLVCDSIAFATGGPPEAAEHATAYARAVRQIGIGSLHLAHVNKSETGDQRPFGSSFWHNAARSTWNVKPAERSQDGDRLTIGLFNRKSNLTRLHPAMGFAFDFEKGRVHVEPVDVADVSELAENLPAHERMRRSLQRGPKTLAELADDTGESVDTLDRTVRRKKLLFTRVPSPDGITRIALAERRAS